MKTFLRSAIGLATSPRTVLSLGEPLFWAFGHRFRKRGNLAQARRVLIVRLDAIGDMVLTIPFIRELRHSLPEAWITLVVSKATFNLVELCPYVNEVLPLEAPAPGRLVAARRIRRALKFASAHLWRRRFDVAIVPRWDVDHYAASFLAYFSGAAGRIGYSEKTTPLKSEINRDYDLLYSQFFNSAHLRHEALRNLDLLKRLELDPKDSRLELWTSVGDEVVVQQLLGSSEQKPYETWIALALGTTDPKKAWPLTRYLQIGKWLIERGNTQLVLVGGEKEMELGDEFAREVPSTVNLIGKLSLRQTAVMLEQCQLYVGNDTGPMHLAAAVGVPVVEICCHPISGDLKHYNSPARFGPWRVPHRVLQPSDARGDCKEGCTASEPHCILGVHIEAVQEAMLSLLPSEPAATADNAVRGFNRSVVHV